MKKKRRAKNECGRPKRGDILQMSGGEQMGSWGHTCGPLKSDPPFFFFGWGVTFFPSYRNFVLEIIHSKPRSLFIMHPFPSQ